MKRYAKLVHYELHRFRKIYAALLLVTVLSQFAGLFIYVHWYMSSLQENAARKSMTVAQYVAAGQGRGLVRIDQWCNGSLWYNGPIMLCAAALLLYVFLNWYRDWLGKNMFIYRLLMLPSSRAALYMSKLSVILLAVLGLVGFQILLLPLQNAAFNALIPSDLRLTATVYDIVANQPLLRILIPQTFVELVLYYVAGAAAVIVVFTAILLERSYRVKGAVGGILLCVLAVAVFLLPLILAETAFPGVLYPSELFAIEVVVGVLVAGASLWLGLILLNKKVSV
jgi:hypothetical protein